MIVHHIGPKSRKKWHPVWEICHKSFDVFSGERRLWDDKDGINNLVKNNYKEYYSLYKSFPKHIMRIDFARLCILHKFGGVYADLDVYCYKDFNNMIMKDRFNIVEAPYGDVPVENAIMYAPAGCSFIEKAMELCREVYESEIKGREFNLNMKYDQLLVGLTAGPQLIYNTILKYGNMNNFNVLDGDMFNNHGLAYSDRFYSKHVLTGIWGKDALEHPDIMYNKFLVEMEKFGGERFRFDFLKDYTAGAYMWRERKREDIVKSVLESQNA